MYGRRQETKTDLDGDPVMTLGDAQAAIHEAMNQALRQAIVPRKAIDETAFLDDFQSANASPIVFQVQADRPCLITEVVISFTPIGAATLIIGDRTIPILATNNLMPFAFSCNMVVKPGDNISLVAVGATALFLEVMGHPLAGVEWSRI